MNPGAARLNDTAHHENMYILILTLYLSASGLNGGQSVAAAIHSVEFSDQKACETAAARWLKDAKDNARNASAFCTKK
jgi:hypothetical protein